MALTQDDLKQIRVVVKDVVDTSLVVALAPINKRLDTIEGELEAIRNDIKETYGMIAELQKAAAPKKAFAKLTLEQKLLKINEELLAAAKQAGITLPR